MLSSETSHTVAQTCPHHTLSWPLLLVPSIKIIPCGAQQSSVMAILIAWGTEGDGAWGRMAPSRTLATLSHLGPKQHCLASSSYKVFCEHKDFTCLLSSVWFGCCPFLSIVLILLALCSPVPYPQFPLSFQIPIIKYVSFIPPLLPIPKTSVYVLI